MEVAAYCVASPPVPLEPPGAPVKHRTFILTGDRRKAGALVLAGWTVTGMWPRLTAPNAESKRLLRELARRGIYGVDVEAVAARFGDEGVQRFVRPVRLRRWLRLRRRRR